jgi:hypothetical protein
MGIDLASLLFIFLSFVLFFFFGLIIIWGFPTRFVQKEYL